MTVAVVCDILYISDSWVRCDNLADGMACDMSDG